MKTIFNTCVKVESQEQADILKHICVENNLPVSNNKNSFVLSKRYKNLFHFEAFLFESFSIGWYLVKDLKDKNIVLESEWLELLKHHQCTE